MLVSLNLAWFIVALAVGGGIPDYVGEWFSIATLIPHTVHVIWLAVTIWRPPAELAKRAAAVDSTFSNSFLFIVVFAIDVAIFVVRVVDIRPQAAGSCKMGGDDGFCLASRVFNLTLNSLFLIWTSIWVAYYVQWLRIKEKEKKELEQKSKSI